MRRRCAFLAGLGCSLLLWTPAGLGAEAAARVAPRTLRATDARVHAYERDGRIIRLYGEAFAGGASPEATAEAFLEANGDLLGARRADLAPVGPFDDGRHLQPIMPDPAGGAAKFTGVYYTQQRGGVPVFRTRLLLLVRNTEGFPLVLATPDLRDLGAFAPDLALLDDPKMAGAIDAARRTLPGLANVTPPEAVIWAGLEDEPAAPALAWTFIADSGAARNGLDAERWLFVTDARTGDVLHLEDMIVHADITGTVKGLATEGLGADVCGPEVPTGLPYIDVAIQSHGEDTAVDGSFAFTDLPEEPTLIKAYMAGRWFRIEDQQGSESFLEQIVTPPAVVDFLHNPSNERFQRAEINAYLHANIVRDYALSYNAEYPTIATQEKFRVNVNIDATCNAYYDGQAINFYARGGGCANTAFSSVVYHEYGHHLVRTGGSGQGEYGEGMSDIVAVLIHDDPGLGYGFTNDCDNPIRNADNDCRYVESGCSTCGQEVHACGRLISGCVWSLREELAATNPDTYREILSSLAINSILLHTGTSIRPEIAIDFLVLDDDNGNLFDGAPHWDEITTSFAAHDMDVPELECPGDIDASGDVGFSDILLVLAAWGPCDGCPEDLDQDGTVEFDDVLQVLSLWGPCF